MDIKRAYRFRFYPTPEQEVILAQTFGCVRFVYNHMLRLRSEAWEQRQERMGYHDTSAALTLLKKQPEYAWLNEARILAMSGEEDVKGAAYQKIGQLHSGVHGLLRCLGQKARPCHVVGAGPGVDLLHQLGGEADVEAHGAPLNAA